MCVTSVCRAFMCCSQRTWKRVRYGMFSFLNCWFKTIASTVNSDDLKTSFRRTSTCVRYKRCRSFARLCVITAVLTNYTGTQASSQHPFAATECPKPTLNTVPSRSVGAISADGSEIYIDGHTSFLGNSATLNGGEKWQDVTLCLSNTLLHVQLHEGGTLHGLMCPR